jgi:nucleotide-binding universal stress UspA family protein
MFAFKHVLVATDFEQPARRAADLALTLADGFGARVTLLAVVPIVGALPGIEGPVAALEESTRRALAAETSRLEEQLSGVQGVMRRGVPWEEILAASNELGADLIVVGTRGRRALPRALLGSVAERVLRLAAVPVLSVASEDERVP